MSFEHEPVICPVCHGRGEVSRFYRDYVDTRLTGKTVWWELGFILMAGLLFLACAWVGVRAWDQEATLAEQQAREFYGERQ